MTELFRNDSTRRFDVAVVNALSPGSRPAHLATRETYAPLRETVYLNLINRQNSQLARCFHDHLLDLFPRIEIV